ncbi:peptidyl-tRNA hydrolase [Candidatus Geothermarchaeota archaeon]|nr:MAG: peptidyl-tRNA hydrolase [Candidatus Geothermarchaeota archaeon]
MQEYKQVIAVREDLKMSIGKLAAQVAHASLSAYEICMKTKKEWANAWKVSGQAKIVCAVKNLNELKKLAEKSKKLGIPHFVVIDRGLTELPSGTITCIGIGPAPSRVVNKVTGSLRLLR